MRPIQAYSTHSSCISGVPNAVHSATPVPTRDKTRRGRARDQAAATERRKRERPRMKEARPDSLRGGGRSKRKGGESGKMFQKIREV